MKKAFLSLGILALAAGAAQAQTPANTVGITAGYGRTSLTGKNSNYSSVTHAAYQAGLTADVYLGEVFSFHPEVLYTRQYYDATEGGSPSLDNLSRDVSYLNVPLLARYHADGLFFEAGPSVNVALSAINEAGADIKSRDVSTVVLDYVVGLGYQLNHGPSIGIRYDGGATNTYKDTASNGLGTGKLKNSTFWLNLGYSFGGSK